MLDIDFSCTLCVREAIERRFLYYPFHTVTRVCKLNENAKEHCTICGGTGARYMIAIQLSSLDATKAQKERSMILEAKRNAEKIRSDEMFPHGN